MKRLFAWLRSFFRWLDEARLVWIALLVVLLALFLLLRSGATELHIRATGLVLEWLGIGTVVHGVHETRKLFGRPSIVQLFRGWLSRFPRWRRQVIQMSGAGSLSLSGGSASMYVWSNVDSNAPLQEQVTALARNLERLNERLNQTQKELDEGLRRHSEALGQEQQTRTKGHQDLQRQLEVAETGGLHVTFVGVIWLFLGALLATMAPELAGLVP